MEILTLLCWVRGEDAKRVFEVEISKDASVGKLKATLKRDRSAILKDVDAADLELYPLFIPSNAKRAAELEKWRSQDKEPLDVEQRMDQAFPNRRNGKWVVVATHRAPPLLHDNLLLTPSTLLCWVRGSDVDHVFEVEIAREANVGKLKATLKRENPDTFKDVDVNTLSLYPLFVPSDGNRAVELGKWRLHGKKPLDIRQNLFNAFPRTQDGEWVVVVNHPTATTKFRVYFRNETLLVSAVAHDMVRDFLSNLLRDQQHRRVFKDVSASQFNVYRLNPPVLVTEGKKFLEHLEPMKGTDAVELSFGESTVTPQHVCMALMLAEDESSKAIEALKRNHSEIFSCLKLTVRRSLKWTKDDVESNLGGGRYTEHNEAAVPEIRKIQELLRSRRIYDNTVRGTTQQVRDLEMARQIDEQLFEQIFTALSGNRDGVLMVRNSREFSTFYHVLRCYYEDATKIRDQQSSAVRAGNFATYFIQPPFLSPGNPDIKYQTEMPWGFPLFVGTNAVDSWRKYTPKSDLMVSSAGHLIPFFVSEVISVKNEEDRFRMLLQAIAVARAGKKLLKNTSKRRFFVVAVYLDKGMVASRYIVTQTGRDRDGAGVYQGNAVSIHRDDFDLTNKTKAIEFVREMYNLVGELNNLVEDLDKNMAQTLNQIVAAAKDVLSLHSRNRPVTRTQATRLDTINEERDLGVFGATDVQEHLRSMKCAVDFRVFGHENLAVVKCETGESVGYLKFVEPSRQQEVEILQFLGNLQSPMNHTISGAQFWSVNGGTMISMPIAGGRLTSLKRPDEHLWSAASQLVEGVAFMHAQLVAHMDIKPENIVIPTEGGRLSIIDFSVAIRLKSEKEKFRGIVGTPGYTAPEVERGDAYKPIQADLWSCGRTLEVLCSDCKPSFDRNFLLRVAAELMSEDADQRPTMSRVQEWIASKKVTLSAETRGFRYPSHLVACA